MSRSPSRITVAVAALLLVGSQLDAQTALADDPDPLALITQSAEALASADSASVDFVVSTLLVRDEMRDDMSATFGYRTAPEGRFSFVTVSPDGEAPRAGYKVAGNGEVTMTALLGRRQHMLEADDDGFATFIRSPASEGIGSGLGGLALSLLHPATAAELVESIEESEYLGIEDLDGESLHHARYVVAGGITCEFWFQTEGTPLIRRIAPDLLSTPGIQTMAKRFDKFDYQVNFEFNEWNTEAGLTNDDVLVEEPKNSLLMTSFYRAPPRQPHELLGAKAPPFELSTPEGEDVSFGESRDSGATLLEFWAISCPLCIQAMPELEKLHEKYAEKGLDYLAVNVSDQADDIAAFLEQRGLDPKTVVDTDGEVGSAYNVSGIPLILVVDAKGRVQSATAGYGPGLPAMLDEQIDATLAGKDLAAKQLEEQRQAEAKRTTERKRLKSLLDG